jgi:competence protein ComEA
VSDLDRPRLALYVALGAVVCFLGARYVAAQATRDPGRAGTTVAPAEGRPESPAAAAGVRVGRAGGGRVTVHVAGAVRRPGVYRLGAGARIGDALRRAGGARPRADLDAVNLAAKLEDGRQVLVPVRGASVASAAPGTAAASAPGGTAAPAQPINLNTATVEQLDTLDGVGPGIAQRILDFREQHGGFRSVEQLGEVPGIGPKRLATLRPLVTL